MRIKALAVQIGAFCVLSWWAGSLVLLPEVGLT